MRNTGLFVIATLLAPGALFGASREIQELQRDVAQLQDQVRTLQSGFDQRIAALQQTAQQSLDFASRADKGVSVLSSGINQTLERELKQGVAPVPALAAKVDNVANDMSEVRNAVADLNTQVNKMVQILNDLNNAVKVLQAPPAAPPGASSPGATNVPPPPAATLFGNAARDQNGGKADLAISEYIDFMKFYPDDPNAASALLNIGEIHQSQGKYDLAVQDFDGVIERYSSNKVTPDAYFMKGMALKASGRGTAAIATFRALVSKYPHTDQEAQAKEQLRAMGVPVAAGAGTSAAKKKKQ